ncbi:MAG: succinate dehydrogenase/fumarate reductase iron-sulfur subunit [Alphaproteobacteria bacterium]|nr:succinate dehydrogenase/fumarate reductase iron-sulfur subunit [Alphaproteobacteria bacterium]
MEDMLAVSIWRGGEDGEFVSYDVPRLENQTVLDVVTYVQRKLDPGLSYRFACRVGMCGSCAMTVNGRARWTCRTHVSRVADDGRLEIAPLRNLPVVKDLSVDMVDFFDKWAKAGGAFSPTKSRADDFAAIPPGDAKRRQANAGIECIGCAVCYTSCDVVTWKPGYLGPAALNRAWTLVNDTRDGLGRARLRLVAGDDGCLGCHSQQGCQEHCPKSLSPTAAIAGLKRAVVVAVLKGKL